MGGSLHILLHCLHIFELHFPTWKHEISFKTDRQKQTFSAGFPLVIAQEPVDFRIGSDNHSAAPLGVQWKIIHSWYNPCASSFLHYLNITKS